MLVTLLTYIVTEVTTHFCLVAISIAELVLVAIAATGLVLY
jgi:hypothetical protein